MLLGKLYTLPLQDHEGDKAIGQFELDVVVDDKLFRNAGDKPGLVRRQFAVHLASAMTDTQVPAEYWQAIIEEKVAKHTGLPSFLRFGVRK